MRDVIERPPRSFRALVGLDGPSIAWGRVGTLFLALLAAHLPGLLLSVGHRAGEPDLRTWIFAVLSELLLVGVVVAAFRLIRRDTLAAAAAALVMALLGEPLVLLVFGRSAWTDDPPAARLVLVGVVAACFLARLLLLVALLPRLRSAWWAVALATLAAAVANSVGYTLWLAFALGIQGAWVRVPQELVLGLCQSAILAGALWGAATGEPLAPLLFSWRGRIGRARYWAAWVGLVPLSLSLVSVMWGLPPEPRYGRPDGLALLALPFWALGVWSGLALAAKRLHDRALSAWHLLDWLVPVVGGLYLLVVVGALRGTPGPNRFGPDPLAPQEAPPPLPAATGASPAEPERPS